MIRPLDWFGKKIRSRGKHSLKLIHPLNSSRYRKNFIVISMRVSSFTLPQRQDVNTELKKTRLSCSCYFLFFCCAVSCTVSTPLATTSVLDAGVRTSYLTVLFWALLWKLTSSILAYEAQITAGMTKAFQMANDASNQLFLAPRNPHIDAVAKLLFGTDGKIQRARC